MIFIYLEEDYSATYLGKEIAREATVNAIISEAKRTLRDRGVIGEYEVLDTYGRRVEMGFIQSIESGLQPRLNKENSNG